MSKIYEHPAGHNILPVSISAGPYDTYENRQRSRTLQWQVPHHPIVTWQDWVCELDAIDRIRDTLKTDIERAVTREEITAFRLSAAKFHQSV